MQIKAVKLFEGGEFTEEFVFGGENKADGRKDVTYPGSLQNYVIDTGNEVILVDTGFAPGTPFKGYNVINDYIPALEAAGYKPEQVSKILVTHKHPDHTGMLSAFPNAKIYIGPEDSRETLDRVREFVKNNPTIYLSTHTPEGVANLEGKIIMKL